MLINVSLAAEPVYVTLSCVGVDGHWSGPHSVLRHGGPFVSVEADREEKQESRLREHFQQRQPVAAPDTVQSSRGSGRRAEGPAGLGTRRRNRAGTGSYISESSQSQERTEDQRERCTGLTLAESFQSPQVQTHHSDLLYFLFY